MNIEVKLNNGEKIIINDINVNSFKELMSQIDTVSGEGFAIFDEIAIKKKQIDYVELVGETK